MDIHRNYIYTIVYILKQINFHKLCHFSDMLLQLVHLKIYINILKFEFKIVLKIIQKILSQSQSQVNSQWSTID